MMALFTVVLLLLVNLVWWMFYERTEALELIDRRSFDIVLTDLSMPGIFGITILGEALTQVYRLGEAQQSPSRPIRCGSTLRQAKSSTQSHRSRFSPSNAIIAASKINVLSVCTKLPCATGIFRGLGRTFLMQISIASRWSVVSNPVTREMLFTLIRFS